MADLLALSWDRRQLSGIEFSSGTAGPRILGGFCVNWPEQPPTASWLRDTLRQKGIGARQVILALPREDVVLRLLELPQVSDDELPTLVRFQAAARSAQPLEQLLLDYLPLPSRADIAQKDVWLATASLTTIDPIRALLNEAGLELTKLTLSSFSLTELIATAEGRRTMNVADASLAILRVGSRMELAVICQRQLIAAHAVKWSSASEIPPASKMLSEVSRLLVQVRGWLPDATLQRAWVIGEDADVGELPDAVSKRWNCPVQRFDLWRDCGLTLGGADLEGPSSEYAIAAGLALIQSAGLTPKLDLLHPRQPPPKRDPRKPLYAAAAAAGLLVVSFTTAIIQQSLAAYDTEISRMRTEDEELGRWIASRKPVETATKSIEDWQSRNINQLNQIAEIYQLMHGTSRLVIADYRFNSGTGNVLAKLKVVGKARERKDYERLAENLDELPNFKVPATGEQKSGDPDYSSRFDFDMEIVPVKKKAPTSPQPETTGMKSQMDKSQ
jgi:hypothetical protein